MKKSSSLLHRWFGSRVIKGGIEIYDKHESLPTSHKYGGSIGLATVDEKFMEPGTRHASHLSTSHQEPVKDKKLVESIKVSELAQSTPVKETSNKPKQVATPKPFNSAAADPEFLPGVSDRSNHPLAEEKRPLDLSKISATVDLDRVNHLVHEKLMQTDSKLFRLVKYP